jgi:hypothetical protein
MTETTSRSQLRRCEAGWTEGGDDPWPEEHEPRRRRGAIRVSLRTMAKPVSSRDRNVDAADVRGRVGALIKGDLPGCRLGASRRPTTGPPRGGR